MLRALDFRFLASIFHFVTKPQSLLSFSTLKTALFIKIFLIRGWIEDERIKGQE